MSHKITKTILLSMLAFICWHESALATDEYPKIIEAKNAEEIIGHLEHIKNCTVFCDVDDTIFTPISNNYRAEVFKEIGQNKDHEMILSNWRLQRKIMLVDSEWPDVINKLKQRYPVYGLTEIESGKSGNIPSVEDWRFEELKKLGVEFTVNSAIQEFDTSLSFDNNPVFYNGIFIAGDCLKSQVLKAYQKILVLQYVVVIDDLMGKLKEIETFCQNESIGFLGIHFRKAAAIHGESDAEIASFQKNHLLQHQQWLEDAEAISLMKIEREST